MRMESHVHYGRYGKREWRYTFIVTDRELQEYHKNNIYTDWRLPGLARSVLLKLIAIHDYLASTSQAQKVNVEVINTTTPLLPPSQ